MDQRELYNVRDLPQGVGGILFSRGEGHKFLLRAPGESEHMGIHILGHEEFVPSDRESV